MISTELAHELRNAGLAWQPAERDCFAIPGDAFAGQVFSLNGLPTLIELLWGQPAITFHGSSEWALDHLHTADAIWLPSETQLREAIVRIIGPEASLVLEYRAAAYHCRAGDRSVDAPDAESAYARMLLALLHQRYGQENAT